MLASHISLNLVMLIRLKNFLLGFDTTIVLGWAISVARSDNTFFLWSSFWNYREGAWHANRCDVLWDLTWACRSSITWTGLWSSGLLFLSLKLGGLICTLSISQRWKKLNVSSIFKVYQARLRSTGEVVAVKVQRPGVQSAISLDILILRYLSGLLKKAGKLNTDLQVLWYK